MVIKRFAAGVAVLVVLTVISSCEFFTSSPFPGYLGNLEYQYDYSSNFADYAADQFEGDLPILYELFPVKPAGVAESQLYLVMSEFEDSGFINPDKYILLLLNRDGSIVQNLTDDGTPLLSETVFWSRPFGLTQTDTVLIGRVSIDATDPTNDALYTGVPNDHGGFVLALAGTGTYLLSENGGSKGSFSIRYDGFDDGAGWSVLQADKIINIIPPAEHPTTEELINSEDPLGYKLRGVMQVSGGYRFLLEFMPTETLFIFSLTNAQFADYTTDTLTNSLREVNGASVPTIDVSNSFVYYYSDGTEGYIIVRRLSGRFERYDIGGQLLDQAVAERGSGVTFAFTPEGEYMYRLNPETGSLTVYRTWWSQ